MKHQWLKQVQEIARGTCDELVNAQVIGGVISGQATMETYPVFLRQTHDYVRFSKPILEACTRRLRELGGREDLIRLFEIKAMEENGHETWALDDWEALGLSRHLVMTSAPSPAVREYLAWNMKMAESNTPLGFLGTAYVLEYISQALAPRAVKNLLEANRIPNIGNALSFLRSHGEADEDHIRVLDELLASIEGKADRNAIVWSAAETRRLYPRFFAAQQLSEHDDPVNCTNQPSPPLAA